ncbi:hypothetical protein ACM55I_14470 [Flavobacterium sp. GB2R13]|uniref:hypothetical protein n=1 Tax=Flavobacterium algoris TaxID=3398733 RepID=UPI003A8AE53E
MKNRKIEIYNVGPIKEVKLDLNRVNVFMGEQSSGKSTISKIISYCSWVEKDVALQQSFKNYSLENNHFIEKLAEFHKMKGYFNDASVISYESDTVKFRYSLNNFDISWVKQFEYKRSKISYIPSERNIVILPEMEKIELSNNNIRSFLFDWFDARKIYTEDNKLSILDLNLDYYYTESTKENHIVSNQLYDILLSNGSSGVQSITPLVVMIDYLTTKIYLDAQSLSYEAKQSLSEATRILFNELLMKPLFDDYDEASFEEKTMMSDLMIKRLEGKEELVMKCALNYTAAKNNLFKTSSTKLIIEEPEQNLFPSTQQMLVYYLMKSINNDLDHNLTLTTHSPYILYAINNCIMASLVFDKLSVSEKEKLNCLDSKIDPKLISIYEIKDGKINSIQQEDGLIGENFFDNQMRNVMDEFYVMLNHY